MTATAVVQFLGLGILTMMGMISMWILVAFGFLTVPAVGYRFFGAERSSVSSEEGGTSNEHHGGMIVAALIRIMIAIVVGVTLMPTITSSISQVEETAAASGEPISGTLSVVLDMIPIIFIAALILGVISRIGSSKEKEKSVTIKLVKNPKGLIVRVERQSKSLGLEQYISNLDAYLGIRTVEIGNQGTEFGLCLTEDNTLQIDPLYDWYLVNKETDRDMFKVVGLHKEDKTKNRAYILGAKVDGPCLYEIHTEYVEKITETPWKEAYAA